MTLTVSLDNGSAHFVELSDPSGTSRVSLEYVRRLEYVGRFFSSRAQLRDTYGDSIDADLELLVRAGCLRMEPSAAGFHDGGDMFSLADLGRTIVELPRPA